MTGRRSMWWRASLVAAQVVTVAGFIVLWQMLSDSHAIDPLFFSAPRSMGDSLRSWAQGGVLWRDLLSTLMIFVVGYVLGSVLGVVLGLVTATAPILGEALGSFVAFMNGIPRLILMPLFLIWFGFGYKPQYAYVASVVLFLVALNVAAGLKEVPSVLVANTRVLGANRRQLIAHVYLPSIAVWLTSTARVSVGYALQGAIIAGFVGASRGLGAFLVAGQANLRVNDVYAALAVAMALAVVVDLLLILVERRATRWLPRNA